MKYFSKKGQSMTEYVVVLMLCVITAWVGTSFFQQGLQRVYRNATTRRTGIGGMAP